VVPLHGAGATPTGGVVSEPWRIKSPRCLGAVASLDVPGLGTEVSRKVKKGVLGYNPNPGLPPPLTLVFQIPGE